MLRRSSQQLEFSLLVNKVPGSNPGLEKLAWIFTWEKVSKIDWQHL